MRDSQSQSTDESAGKDDFQLWSEAAGGKKKGRIYSLGSQGYALDAQSSLSSYPASAVKNIIRRQMSTFMMDDISRQVATQVEIIENELKAKMQEELQRSLRAARRQMRRRGKGLEGEEEEEEDD